MCTYHRVLCNCYFCILHASLLCSCRPLGLISDVWKGMSVTTIISVCSLSWLFTVIATIKSIELDEVLDHGSCRKVTATAYYEDLHTEWLLSAVWVNLNACINVYTWMCKRNT